MGSVPITSSTASRKANGVAYRSDALFAIARLITLNNGAGISWLEGTLRGRLKIARSKSS